MSDPNDYLIIQENKSTGEKDVYFSTRYVNELNKQIKQLEDAMKYIKLCADRVLAKCEKMDNPDMWVIQQEAEKALEK